MILEILIYLIFFCVQNFIVRPSNPLTNMKEINALHAAILCAGAYINLSIENYTVAVKQSQELLSLKNVPGAYE